MYKGFLMRLTVVFFSEIMKTRIKEDDIFKFLKEKDY